MLHGCGANEKANSTRFFAWMIPSAQWPFAMLDPRRHDSCKATNVSRIFLK